ncbi:L,D-transpeptidase [Actinospica sp. MGRD01-02]|uniref:L,D-transpeptidase n=1 Tax=Actinospica acidithermotolerans TaxID=2828514 RepID=A0A941E7E7_9ACTN|nr:L,D-transpeptidase [Actinospica acidithermotolerans]MBR7825318.1 L,D-transpeptidase [Actinospica acidithermotolerans]
MGKGTRAAGSPRRAASAPPSYGTTPNQAAGAGRRGSAAPPPQTRSAARQNSGKPSSGRGATFSVLMMTIVALAAVGVLAAQAEATAPKVRAQASNASTTKTTKSGSSGSSSVALPANSGSGTRIVYSATQKRIWLAQSSTVERTMPVVPGTETPADGSYTVTSKAPGATGGDDVQVLYVVRFGGSYGFDAEANITGLPPAPTGKTGGIRMAQLDAQALYDFASVGTTIVVVP